MKFSLEKFDEKYMGTLEVMSIIVFGALTVFYYLALLIGNDPNNRIIPIYLRPYNFFQTTVNIVW